MKFVFADSLDYVDPNYDFSRDRSSPAREPYWNDVYPHEIFSRAPYDGLLVSRAIVGDHSVKGKYTDSQAMRFRRVGAREFLRYRENEFPGSMMMGDCGAFAYHKMEKPPFSPEDMVTFYIEGGFSHGCSVDHLIFDFSPNGGGTTTATQENLDRYELTLENATKFLGLCKTEGVPFEPIGVVQGWSPRSMADAAASLQKMGYKYLAIGGMAPLRADSIKRALGAIREKVGFEVPIHLLGFAKAEQVEEFKHFKIASFDTTSPLLRAFKDDKANFYARGCNGRLKYYTALRIPQARENPKLQRLVKSGAVSLDDLLNHEQAALESVRSLGRDGGSVDEVVDRLRGAPGTEVEITVRRGRTQEFPVSLERAVIQIPTAKQAMIRDDIGYLRIIQFTPYKDDRVREAVEFFRENEYGSMIIDLRNNPGGVLDGVVDVADLFFDGGLVVGTRGRVESENVEYRATEGRFVSDELPIVVLIDGGSASAAEILAGAMKDRERAFLLGETTYGKGSVQQVRSIGLGGFRLTMAR